LRIHADPFFGHYEIEAVVMKIVSEAGEDLAVEFARVLSPAGFNNGFRAGHGISESPSGAVSDTPGFLPPAAIAASLKTSPAHSERCLLWEKNEYRLFVDEAVQTAAVRTYAGRG
jgi:hypothetical protein